MSEETQVGVEARDAAGNLLAMALVNPTVAIATASSWAQGLPNACIYIGGEPFTAVGQQSSEVVQDEEMLTRHRQLLRGVYEDLQRGYAELKREMLDHYREARELLLEQERQLYDEAARHRALTTKSLADIDLLGRVVKTTELTKKMNGEATLRSNVVRMADKKEGR